MSGLPCMVRRNSGKSCRSVWVERCGTAVVMMYLHPHPTMRHQSGLRPTQEEPLSQVATHTRQHVQSTSVLDSFGTYPQAQIVTKVDNGTNDDGVALISMHLLYETAVDLVQWPPATARQEPARWRCAGHARGCRA